VTCMCFAMRSPAKKPTGLSLPCARQLPAACASHTRPPRESRLAVAVYSSSVASGALSTTSVSSSGAFTPWTLPISTLFCRGGRGGNGESGDGRLESCGPRCGGVEPSTSPRPPPPPPPRGAHLVKQKQGLARAGVRQRGLAGVDHERLVNLRAVGRVRVVPGVRELHGRGALVVDQGGRWGALLTVKNLTWILSLSSLILRMTGSITEHGPHHPWCTSNTARGVVLGGGGAGSGAEGE
jgi:hypothetical protein